MKKKGLLVAVGIVLILVVLGVIFLPKRIKLYNAVKDNIESLGPEGEMFEEYDVVDDSLFEIKTDYFTIGVPGGCIHEDRDVIDLYQSLDGSEHVAISKNVNDIEVSFFDSSYGDESEVFGIEYKMEDLKDGFEKLGYGIPDSTYDTYKCLYLLKGSDYSFWDYKKGLAYANAAFVKNETMWMDANYVYERDDMYALIMERNLVDEGVYVYYVDLYNPNNLNQSNMVVIRVKDKQQAYAIINSIELR